MINFDGGLKRTSFIILGTIFLAACAAETDVSENTDISGGTESVSQADFESRETVHSDSLTDGSETATVDANPANPTDVEFGDSNDDYRPIKAQIDVLAWGEESYGETLVEPVPMFFGDVNGDDIDDVLAVIYVETGVSGFSAKPTVFISEGEDFHPYQTLGPIDGVEPRDVSIRFGEVSLTTTIHAPGDAMCCPTEPKSWTLELDFLNE